MWENKVSNFDNNNNVFKEYTALKAHRNWVHSCDEFVSTK